MRLARLAALGAAVLTVAMAVAPSSRSYAAACVSSVGPGISPPAGLTFGVEGLHAAWYGQSGYMTLCPGTESLATVAYYNTGTRGWVLGREGQTAFLGSSDSAAGIERPSALGGDGTNGSPNTGWPRYNRLAVQPAPYVGPGQVAWFQFRVRAPLAPGRYSIGLRPVIEGSQWLEDYGVFWVVVVLNPDGTVPGASTTPVAAPIATPAPTPTPAQQTITKTTRPNQVNSITRLSITPAPEGARALLVSGEWFSFLTKWTGDSSYVALHVDLDTGRKLYVVIGEAAANIYDTTGGGFSPIGQAAVTQSQTADSRYFGQAGQPNQLEFVLPRSILTPARSASITATGAWAQNSPTCSAYSCSWYEYDDIGPGTFAVQ